MCERYALPEQLSAEREFVPALVWWKFDPRFNVAANQYVPAIRLYEGQSEAVMMRWGLIPSEAKEEPREALLRVQAAELECSPASRDAWRNSQRCILPTSGFYAWQLTRSRYRQPHFVGLIDRSVFGLAAVWDRWVSDNDDVIESCCLVSVAANQLMREVANTDRGMPAILRRRDYETWLRGSLVEAADALQTYSSDRMLAYPVSPRVNSSAADGAALIRPVRLAS
jgi:putative SOS response-associated peptidase YedK